MKKIKRINMKQFIEEGRIDYHNWQRARMSRGINDIMKYLEKLSKKVDRLIEEKEDKEIN